MHTERPVRIPPQNACPGPVEGAGTSVAHPPDNVPALALTALQAWYGDSHILHGVDMQVWTGRAVALLGRNGAGRTTTLRAIMGLTSRRTGSVRVQGIETIAMPTHRVAGLGVGYCPEERGIFAPLSCEENLLLPPVIRGAGRSGLSLSEIYALFPNLYVRRHTPGNRLSGGEQQMLAVARILRTGARLLLLDEISEGLAPVIVQALAHMVEVLKTKGYTIVMVEQNVRFAAPLVDDFYVMAHGRIVEQFPAAQLPQRQGRLDRLLSV